MRLKNLVINRAYLGGRLIVNMYFNRYNIFSSMGVPVFNPPYEFNADEGQTDVGTITAIDPNDFSLIYSIDPKYDYQRFTINPETGVLTFTEALDYDNEDHNAIYDPENHIYAIYVRATNAEGNTSKKLIKVTLNNVSSTPTNIMLDNDIVNENEDSGTLVGTMTAEGIDNPVFSLEEGGEDNGSFDIVGDQLFTFDIFNYEQKNQYHILIKATDGVTTHIKSFTIRVANVVEAPSGMVLSNNEISEELPINTTIGTLTAVREEPITNSPVFTLTPFVEGENNNDKFQITGNVLKTNAILDFETTPSLLAEITVTIDGLSFTKSFTISVTDVLHAPTIIAPATSLSIAENISTAFIVVATDPENKEILYSIVGGADMNKFTINPYTGVVSFIQTPDYEFPDDYGLNRTYEVIVQATNSDVLWDTRIITITITDVNEITELYVSPTGTDNGAGTIISPLSLTKGLQLINPGGTLYLMNGNYNIQSTLIPSKSGTSSLPVNIRKYTGTPIITGFKQITNWQAEGAGTHIYSAPVTVQSMPNVVRVDSQLANIGRYPTGGWETITSCTNTPSTTITSSRLSGKNWIGAEVVVRKAHWVIDRGTITAHSGSQITFTGTSAEPVRNNFGFFIQNHVDCLTYDGAWCYKNNRIYMYFSDDNPSGHTIEVPSLDTLINFTGRTYINVDGIKFHGGNKRNVYIHSSNNINIDNSLIEYSGGTGLEIVALSTSIRLEDSEINYCYNNGIKSDPGCNYVTINNNRIDNIGMVQGMGANGNNSYQGIMTEGEYDVITNNRITTIGYIGIHSRGQRWEISNNVIDGICSSKDDGAGIYTYGNGINRLIKKNIITNIIGAGEGTSDGIDAANGIYCDDTSTNVEIDENHVEGATHSGIYVHNSNTITITNNKMYNNKYGLLLVHDNNYPAEYIRHIIFDDNEIVTVGNNQSPIYYNGLEDDITSVFDSADGNSIANIQRGNEVARINCYKSATPFKEYWGGINIDEIFTNTNKLEVDIPFYTINSLGSVEKFFNGTFNSVADNVSAGYYPNGTMAISWDNTNKINGGSCKINVTSVSEGVSDGNRAYNRLLGESAISKTDVGDTYVLSINKKYILSFDVVGSEVSTIGVYCRLNAAPWTKLTPEIYFNVDTSVKHHEFLIEPNSNALTAALSFFIDDDTAPVYIDNVSIKEAEVTIHQYDDYLLSIINDTDAGFFYSLGAETYEDITGTVFTNSVFVDAHSSRILYKIERLTFTSSATFNANEHQTAIGTVEAGDGATYMIVGGTDQNKFAIDANTGVLSFLTAPNYEIPTDANTDNDYQVTVRASKNGFTNDQEITVTVQNVTTDNVVIPLIATGTGAGVVELKLYVSSNTTMTIDGNGKFYDDAGGTTNEGTSRNINTGDERTFYVKVTSGTCNITIVDGQIVLTQIRGWSQVTNGPSINNMALTALPSGLTRISVTGNNTITGTLAQLPRGLTYMLIRGSNTISGNIYDLPSTLTFVWLEGDNTVSDYTAGMNWNDSMERLLIIPASGGLSSTEIDNLFIDMDNSVASWVSPKVIYLTGANAAPTATSLTARNSLVAKGVTINVNS